MNDWMELFIETTEAGIDPVCARMIALGVEGLQIDDADEFLAQSRYWDYVDETLMSEKSKRIGVRVYLPATPDGMEQISLIRSELDALRMLDGPGIGSLEITRQDIASVDWENAWKQYYKPTEVGERLLIVPAWEPVPPTDRAVFLNNPGLSFGTGSHASTRLALRLLERHLKPEDTVLDLGCGSGILSICALKLGASRADAIDVDPLAAKVTRENAERNGVAESTLSTFVGDARTDPAFQRYLEGRRYDIVLANIVADIIIGLLDTVGRCLQPGGKFISSGIIDVRRDDMTAALQHAGFLTETVLEEEGWVSILARPAE